MPGQYLIAAFEDTHENLVYQPTECASYIDGSTVISIKQDENRFDLNLTLKHPDSFTLTEAPDLNSPTTRAQLDLPKVQAGEIVTFKDRRFSKKNGQ